MAGMSYLPARTDVVEVVNEVMHEHHPQLVDAGVRINVLMAFGELKLHGYAAAATVKINSLQDRVEGKADATIKIDAAGWRDMKEAEQVAVIDHELHHLTVEIDGWAKETIPCPTDEEPEAVKIVQRPIYKTDDAGRPRLKMRLHDLVVGGFRAIAERHGRNALEVQHVKACHETLRQMTLWGDDMAGATEEEQEAAAEEATAATRKRKGAVA